MAITISKIDSRLIGTWWAYKTKTLEDDKCLYSLYRGDSPPLVNGILPDNAITDWAFPEDEYQLSARANSSVVSSKRDPLVFYIIKNIHFPPSEYIDSGVITEIEILPSGEYLILDSFKL